MVSKETPREPHWDMSRRVGMATRVTGRAGSTQHTCDVAFWAMSNPVWKRTALVDHL